MGWNPRNTYNGIEYGGYAHDYYWNIDYNPDARFSTCLSDCTCLAYGRCLEEGCRGPVPYTRDWSLPSASNWHNRLTNGWIAKDYSVYFANAKAGDIVEWSDANHVAVIEVNSGGTLYCSSSLYTGDHGQAYYPSGSGNYDTRSTAVMGSTLQDVCNWMMDPSRMWRFYEYKTADFLTNSRLYGYAPNYILVNPDSAGPPTPPTPTEEVLTISITPSSYSSTMQYNQDALDFTFDIVITGIPNGEGVSGGNTYPDLVRVANTGWSYTDYVVNGITYRRGQKQQTLRYYREYNIAYTTTKHMYFNITKSTGSISTDTPMYINVNAKGIGAGLRGFLAKRKRRGGRIDVTFFIN